MVNPAFMVIGAGVVIGAILYVAVCQFSRSFQNDQHQYHDQSDSNSPRISILGPCCECQGNVNIVDGRQTPCGHYVHYTCEAALRRTLRSGIHWEQYCSRFSCTFRTWSLKAIPKNVLTNFYFENSPFGDMNLTRKQFSLRSNDANFNIMDFCLFNEFQSVAMEFSKQEMVCIDCCTDRTIKFNRGQQQNGRSGISELGRCCICEDIVDNLNGDNTPCGHFIHNICNASLGEASSVGFEWQQICKICWNLRARDSQKGQESIGLRKKKSNNRRGRTSSALGQCGLCEKTVNANEGHKMPCGHFIHNACETSLTKSLPSEYDPHVICKICLTKRIKESEKILHKTGLRKRVTNHQECANCLRKITKISEMLPCGHEVHEDCWIRMKEISTTCPTCMNMEDLDM